MESWSFHIPTKVVFGVGCLERIADFAESFKPHRIMLVTGRKSMKELGVTDRIVGFLKNYQVVVYDKVEQNPTISKVEEGVQLLKAEKCDLVIGLGGGSAIDTAKAASVLVRNSGRVDEFLSGYRRIVNRRLPLIAVPTTAGTGTEVTQYASVINELKKRKLSLSHEYIHPDVAIVDPLLTVSMPKFVTATTGLDALSQCIEAYWSKHHTPISDVFALNGVRLVFENLVDAFNNPENVGSRENMALASLLSGMAISITKTTIVHSVSYPLTVNFNVPHGLACSLTLPSFIKYNFEVAKDRMYNVARMMDAETIEDCVGKVEKLISDLQLPSRLSDVGVGKEDVELIVKEGFRPDRSGNNPRMVTRDDLRKILYSIL